MVPGEQHTLLGAFENDTGLGHCRARESKKHWWVKVEGLGGEKVIIMM